MIGSRKFFTWWNALGLLIRLVQRRVAVWLEEITEDLDMTLILALLGGILVGVGIFWRLKQIEANAMAATSGAVARRGGGAGERRTPAAKVKRPTLKAARIKAAEPVAPRETGPSDIATGIRRSNRVLLKIPLEVYGENRKGAHFTEKTHTLVINRNGACFNLRNPLALEDEITVKNLQTGQMCRFRARQLNQELPDGAREWGVECAEAAPNFWGIAFPEAPLENSTVEEETVKVLLECTVCHFREFADLTLPQYRAAVEKKSMARYCMWCGLDMEWGFVIVEEEGGQKGSPALKESGAPVAAPTGEERRRDERWIARLPLAIRHEDGREEFTITENVSGSGICCHATMELQVGDRVFATLESDQGSGEQERCSEIMWRRGLSEKGTILYGMRFETEESRPN